MPKSPYHSLQTRTRGIHLTGGKHSSMARAVGEAGRAEENERVGALGIVFRLLGSDGPTAQSDGQASCPAGVPRGRGSGSSALGSGGGGALLVFLAWAPSSPHFLALSWARGQVLFSLTFSMPTHLPSTQYSNPSTPSGAILFWPHLRRVFEKMLGSRGGWGPSSSYVGKHRTSASHAQ